MIKKIMVIVVLVMISILLNQPQSSIKIEVLYDYTVDGDTIYLIENGQKQKYRLLMVDTPETNETLGSEAWAFTQNILENANVIEIEYQEDNELEDQYGRKLVWVFVDGKLLQETLCRQGFVEDLYDNGGHYTYKANVEEALKYAKERQIGIYEK